VLHGFCIAGEGGALKCWRVRLCGGHIRNKALVENEFEIQGLSDLQSFYDKIGSINMHKDWGRKMGEVIVSGSTYWEVYRVVE
jgi:hypothetical protein